MNVRDMYGAALTHLGQYFRRQGPETATNIDALIGKVALVTQDVSSTTGLILINGETWSARVPVGKDAIRVDSRATIVEIDGVYAIVQQCQNAEQDGIHGHSGKPSKSEPDSGTTSEGQK